MTLWETVRPYARKAADVVGYDRTHIARWAANRAAISRLDALPCERLDALEISASAFWKEQRRWGSFTEMNYPEYDICSDTMDRQFDVILADNIWEHLLRPHRAAQNVLKMLKPGGVFINITPFLIRYHGYPIDCTRWTALGMHHLLADVGFEEALIETGSWGNLDAVKANFRRWGKVGWRRSLKNDPEFPVVVWAFAEKARAD